jgi:hypothetical protein
MCDGILVSRTMLEVTTTLKKNDANVYKINTYRNVHYNVLEYCQTKGLFLPTLADPGTWSYHNLFELPEYLYDTEDLINYYNNMQFDLAGSVDWPIIDRIVQVQDGKRKFIDLDFKTKEHRRQLTLELAADFIKKCNKRKKLNFMPFGTIQGYSPKTYQESLRAILKMGYEYIAIGGLPAYSEKHVVELLPMILKEVQKVGYEGGMHLYGRFPSPRYVAYYMEHHVSSFDNNSSHIAACVSPCSYYDPDFKFREEVPTFRCYGIKIPPLTGPMLARLKRRDFELWEKVSKLCTDTFHLFCNFSNSGKNSDLEVFLRSYKKMDKVLNTARINPKSNSFLSDSLERCKTALKLKGWERCGCTACRKAKAHIMMVRGHRIRYLFNHNTHVQYVRYQRELKKAKKIVDYPQYDWSKIREINRLKNIRKAIKRR